METIKRPEFIKDEHLEYLDELRISGVTNMMAAGPYLRDSFRRLSRIESRKVLSYWMKTFGKESR